jgi:HSP20 family protein
MSSPSTASAKADHDTTDKGHFIREVAYGGFQRSFALPPGIDANEVIAKQANGMLEVRIPAPRATTPKIIEVTAN